MEKTDLEKQFRCGPITAAYENSKIGFPDL